MTASGHTPPIADQELVERYRELRRVARTLLLSERDGALAELVRLRFFAGLTIEETAEVLGRSTRTVNRDWT